MTQRTGCLKKLRLFQRCDSGQQVPNIGCVDGTHRFYKEKMKIHFISERDHVL